MAVLSTGRQGAKLSQLDLASLCILRSYGRGEWAFNLSRSIRQDCPLSLMLNVLALEHFLPKLRVNPVLHGLTLPVAIKTLHLHPRKWLSSTECRDATPNFASNFPRLDVRITWWNPQFLERKRQEDFSNLEKRAPKWWGDPMIAWKWMFFLSQMSIRFDSFLSFADGLSDCRLSSSIALFWYLWGLFEMTWSITWSMSSVWRTGKVGYYGYRPPGWGASITT